MTVALVCVFVNRAQAAVLDIVEISNLPDSIQLDIKEKYQLKPLVFPAGARIKYTFDQTKLISISKKGLISGKKAGNAVITVKATYRNWTSAEKTILVEVGSSTNLSGITSFYIPGQYGASIIDSVNKTVTVYLPENNELPVDAFLRPSIGLSDEDATISPASGVVRNFSTPVTYKVEFADINNTVQYWEVNTVRSTTFPYVIARGDLNNCARDELENGGRNIMLEIHNAYWKDPDGNGEKYLCETADGLIDGIIYSGSIFNEEVNDDNYAKIRSALRSQVSGGCNTAIERISPTRIMITLPKITSLKHNRINDMLFNIPKGLIVDTQVETAALPGIAIDLYDRGNSSGNTVNGGFICQYGDYDIYSLQDKIVKRQIESDETEIIAYEGADNLCVQGDLLFYRRLTDKCIYSIDLTKNQIPLTGKRIVGSACNEFSIYDGWIYYSNADDVGKLYCISILGTGSYKVTDASVKNIITYRKSENETRVLYINNSDKCIYMTNGVGKTPEKLSYSRVGKMSMHGNTLYYINLDLSNTICKLSTSDFFMSKINFGGDVETTIPDTAGSTVLNADGDIVFISNGNDSDKIYKKNINGEYNKLIDLSVDSIGLSNGRLVLKEKGVVGKLLIYDLNGNLLYTIN